MVNIWIVTANVWLWDGLNSGLSGPMTLQLFSKNPALVFRHDMYSVVMTVTWMNEGFDIKLWKNTFVKKNLCRYLICNKWKRYFARINKKIFDQYFFLFVTCIRYFIESFVLFIVYDKTWNVPLLKCNGCPFVAINNENLIPNAKNYAKNYFCVVGTRSKFHRQ